MARIKNMPLFTKAERKSFMKLNFTSFFFQREDNKKYHEIAFHTQCQIFKTCVHLMQKLELFFMYRLYCLMKYLVQKYSKK